MTILVIDDDRDFRNGLAANLRDDGHAVYEYHCPTELPSLAELADVGALISDYEIKPPSALSFADEFHTAHPAVPIVLLTTVWGERLESEVAKRDYLHLQRKPLDYEDLHPLLQSASAAQPSPRTPTQR